MTFRHIRALFVSIAVAGLATAADGNPKLLKDIEKRYNSSKTLEANFSETYTASGRKRTESGTLFLRKPGRMRWEYGNPKGKLFISDGKDTYFYDPATNRAEKIKLKETEDLRAPMAFLLGRLDFSKDFQGFETRQESGGVWVSAVPKSDKVPYRQAQFLVTPDSRIARLVITGQDNSVLDFTFTGEKRNESLNDTLFRFQLPPGAQYVDSSQSAGGER